MKLFSRLLLALFFIATVPLSLSAQKDEYKKERKKIWRQWGKNKESYNPYLDKKEKNKPSVKTAKTEKKELKKQKKLARKDMRRSKRRLAKDNKRKAKGK
jgi:ABC-type multidrug transport system fused ATPase/permease subunit